MRGFLLSKEGISSDVTLADNETITTIGVDKNKLTDTTTVSGKYGEFIMTPQGKYSYKSNGDPKAIGKTDVLYYKTSTGKENQIVIRYNISQNNVEVPLAWIKKI